MIRYTRDEWIDKCKKTHGEKYDYSNFPTKVNSTEKFEIICKEHGVFKQYIRDHINGSGCQKCSGKYHPSIEELKHKANEIHGYKYDYSLWPIECKNNRTMVASVCSTHGVFKQSILGHLNMKSGCPSCAGVTRTTVENFITRATKLHGNKYDYSLVKGELNVKSIVKIKCKHHGVFKQQIASHLHMVTGCPNCSNDVQKILYINELTSYDGVLKYGIAVDLKRRLKSFRINNKVKCKPLKHFVFEKHSDCRKAERELKKTFESVLSKMDLKDGYTETTFSYNLEAMINIVLKHGGKLVTVHNEERGMLSV